MPSTHSKYRSELIVTYSGAASGTWNLTLQGPLTLSTPGSYTFVFNKPGTPIKVSGVAAGGAGNGTKAGKRGNFNTSGVSTTVTAFSLAGAVGAGGTGGGNGGDTSFASALSLTGGLGGNNY